ncbi:MAG: S24 family peptidase [Acetobacteraceae bacterium]
MKRNLTLPQSLGAERSAFVSRLQLILKHWPSADRLAREMGVSPSAFRKWLKGEAEPSRERLVALAEVTRVGIGWLARGEGPEPDFVHAGHSYTAGSNGSGGAGIDPARFRLMPANHTPNDAGGRQQGFVGFRHDWIRESLRVEPNVLIMDVAVGDAMTPTVADGDLLLLDASDTNLRQDGIYVLRINGGSLVRRVQRMHDGSVGLIPDNPSYVTDSIPSERVSNLEVIGRVIWIGGTP